MLTKLRHHLTYANVVSTLCMFLLLGGTAFAAVSLRRGQVKNRHLGANAVTSPKVKNASLLAADFAAGQLPKGEKGDTGDQGPAGVVGTVTVQRTDVALADGTTQAAEATCPAGQRAIGGGASVDQTGSDDIKLMVSRPGNGGLIPNDGQQFANTWRVVYRNPAGGTAAAEIRSFVLCGEASGPTSLPGPGPGPGPGTD